MAALFVIPLASCSGGSSTMPLTATKKSNSVHLQCILEMDARRSTASRSTARPLDGNCGGGGEGSDTGWNVTSVIPATFSTPRWAIHITQLKTTMAIPVRLALPADIRSSDVYPRKIAIRRSIHQLRILRQSSGLWLVPLARQRNVGNCLYAGSEFSIGAPVPGLPEFQQTASHSAHLTTKRR